MRGVEEDRARGERKKRDVVGAEGETTDNMDAIPHREDSKGASAPLVSLAGSWAGV